MDERVIDEGHTYHTSHDVEYRRLRRAHVQLQGEVEELRKERDQLAAQLAQSLRAEGVPDVVAELIRVVKSYTSQIRRDCYSLENAVAMASDPTVLFVQGRED